jgi:frataxin-like iron-binding protein CyaY
VSILEHKGLWFLVVPIAGVKFFNDESNEFKIGKTLIIKGETLRRKRKIFDKAIRMKEIIPENFLDDEKTYAVACHGNSGRIAQESIFKQITETLDVLALSQLSGSRRYNAALAIADFEDKNFKTHIMHHYQSNSTQKYSSRIGGFRFFNINDRWRKTNKQLYFIDLIEIIFNEKIPCNKSWREDLKRSAIIGGQSQQSTDIVKAFLWNVIAIETLMTEPKDKISKAIPERIGSFISWFPNWSSDNFTDKISKAYEKRCGFVHAAKYEEITINDLKFTDLLLANILMNIVKNINFFNSKQSVIEFSEMNKARKLLGLKDNPKKYNLHYLSL